MVFAKDNCHEEAVLVFANSSKEAIKIGYPYLVEIDFFIDTRSRKIIEHDFLDKLKKGEEPHCISSPPVCDDCLTWGISELENGLCDDCRGV